MIIILYCTELDTTPELFLTKLQTMLTVVNHGESMVNLTVYCNYYLHHNPLGAQGSVIPTCFKQTTTVSMPTKTKVTCLNNYRPVALTSLVMQCFERLVMDHIDTISPDTLDQLPLAYRPNRSTDDAISISLSHLD
jgi:hypothetical protein